MGVGLELAAVRRWMESSVTATRKARRNLSLPLLLPA
jgi:hypothetical protein